MIPELLPLKVSMGQSTASKGPVEEVEVTNTRIKSILVGFKVCHNVRLEACMSRKKLMLFVVLFIVIYQRVNACLVYGMKFL